MSIRQALIAALPLLATPTTLHAADLIQCPGMIEVRQQLEALPMGWSTFHDAAPIQLAGITFFEGPPDQKASLAPDGTGKKGGRLIATWTFPASAKIYVACRYTNSAIMLTRQLPPDTHSCAIVYKPKETVAGLPSIEKTDCK